MAVIFDMDGVLINSNKAHLASWKKIANEDAVNFSEEIFWKTFGMTSESIVEKYWGNKSLSQAEIVQIVDRKETAFRLSIKKHVEPIPGAIDFVQFLVQKGIKIAVGSSAPRINVDYTLKWLGLDHYFDNNVVAGNEVSQGKPAPDIFLKAAQKINELPQNCIVIDDSKSGVTAGKRAGMTTVGFFSDGHRLEEYEKADYVVKSFEECKTSLYLS